MSCAVQTGYKYQECELSLVTPLGLRHTLVGVCRPFITVRELSKVLWNSVLYHWGYRTRILLLAAILNIHDISIICFFIPKNLTVKIQKLESWYEPGSSVSTVSGKGLDNRAIEVRPPADPQDFSSNLCVQIGCGAHPVSCTMGTGVLSPGLKRGRGVTLTTQPHLVPKSRMSRSYTSSLSKCLRGVQWDSVMIIRFCILLWGENMNWGESDKVQGTILRK
jgi:hypothetical protein